MANLRLTLAVGDYEHTRDLASGDVRAEGIDLTVLRTPIEELLLRYVRHSEWQVSEMGMGPFASLLSRGHKDMVGIPVFTSRVFRHTSLYLRSDAGIQSPADLVGKRIGVPEWAMTAVIYVRAVLQHAYGVDLRSIQWFQAGVNEAGRVDKMNLKLPGFSITPTPTRSLSEMLLAGDLDAIISARAPQPYLEGHPRFKRAWSDVFGEEVAYFDATGVFPIMHMIVLRRDAYEENRWIAVNLTKAFEEAKRRALHRIKDSAVSHFPIPWLSHHVALAQAHVGADFWPYGIEPNRKTLDAYCQWCYEQDVCERRLAVEEFFAPEVLTVSRI